jgi:hypothetical protein
MNIQNYMAARFVILKDEFVSEFERMMAEGDSMDAQIERFLSETRASLLEIFSDEVSPSPFARSISPVMDSVLPGFRECFGIGHRPSSCASAEEVENLNLARASISSFTSLFQNTFSSMRGELSRDISDLRQLQSKTRTMEAKSDERGRIAHGVRIELECQKIRKEIELETIKEGSGRISELKKWLKYSEEDDYAEDYGQSNARRLRSAISKLRRSAQACISDPLLRLRDYHRRFIECRDEAEANREMLLFHTQRFVRLAGSAMAVSDQVVNRGRLMGDIGSPRVSFVERRDDEEIPLINSVKQRLRMIQEERETELLNSASFLESIRREEKRRVRAELAPE